MNIRISQQKCAATPRLVLRKKNDFERMHLFDRPMPTAVYLFINPLYQRCFLTDVKVFSRACECNTLQVDLHLSVWRRERELARARRKHPARQFLLLHPSLLKDFMCSRNLFKKVAPDMKFFFEKAKISHCTCPRNIIFPFPLPNRPVEIHLNRRYCMPKKPVFFNCAIKEYSGMYLKRT